MTEYPSIVRGLPHDAYHAGPEVSRGALWDLHEGGPPLYYHRRILGLREHATASMLLGSAIHCLTLDGQSAFDARYIKGIEGDGRTKAIKEARAAQAAEHPGAIVLSPDDYQTCMGVRDALVCQQPAFAKLLGLSDPEVSIFWKDAPTGLHCRARPDLLAKNGSVIVDLKTSADIRPAKFATATASMGYHMQAAWYIDGCRANGLDTKSWIFAAIETSPPYLSAIYEVDAVSIEVGRRLYRATLDRLATLLFDAGADHPERWIPNQEIQQLSLPRWAIEEARDD